jgi:hypothetical protein
MGIGSIAGLAGSYLLSMLSGAGNNSSASPAAAAAKITTPQDTSLISPFAQILGSLQQLQQSNPSQYSQVTAQIANNLQTGASTATSNGNTALAGQLTQVAQDFRSASQSGQLPNVPDLAQAIGGHRHHHSVSGAPQTTDPATIIENTLNGAAIPAPAAAI